MVCARFSAKSTCIVANEREALSCACMCTRMCIHFDRIYVAVGRFIFQQQCSVIVCRLCICECFIILQIIWFCIVHLHKRVEYSSEVHTCSILQSLENVCSAYVVAKRIFILPLYLWGRATIEHFSISNLMHNKVLCDFNIQWTLVCKYIWTRLMNAQL